MEMNNGIHMKMDTGMKMEDGTTEDGIKDDKCHESSMFISSAFQKLIKTQSKLNVSVFNVMSNCKIIQ